MAKHSVSIDEKLYMEIAEYCRTNGLKITSFCEDLLRDGFMMEKYGDIPFGTIPTKPEEVLDDSPLDPMTLTVRTDLNTSIDTGIEIPFHVLSGAIDEYAIELANEAILNDKLSGVTLVDDTQKPTRRRLKH